MSRFELMSEVDTELFEEQIRSSFPQLEGIEFLLLMDQKTSTGKYVKIKQINELDLFLFNFNNDTSKYEPEALFFFDAKLWEKLDITMKRELINYGLAQCEYNTDSKTPFRVVGLNIADDIDLLNVDPEKRIEWHKKMEQISVLAHSKVAEDSLL